MNAPITPDDRLAAWMAARTRQVDEETARSYIPPAWQRWIDGRSNDPSELDRYAQAIANARRKAELRGSLTEARLWASEAHEMRSNSDYEPRDLTRVLDARIAELEKELAR